MVNRSERGKMYGSDVIDGLAYQNEMFQAIEDTKVC